MCRHCAKCLNFEKGLTSRSVCATIVVVRCTASNKYCVKPEEHNMEKMNVYPPTPSGADYVAAWAQMQHYDGRQHRIKVVCRKGKYCCYIGTARVCAFTYGLQALHWMQAAIHRHSENGFKLLRFTPWGGCIDRRQLVYGGCDCCPWQYECIARDKKGGGIR